MPRTYSVKFGYVLLKRGRIVYHQPAIPYVHHWGFYVVKFRGKYYIVEYYDNSEGDPEALAERIGTDITSIIPEPLQKQIENVLGPFNSKEEAIDYAYEVWNP